MFMVSPGMSESGQERASEGVPRSSDDPATSRVRGRRRVRAHVPPITSDEGPDQLEQHFAQRYNRRVDWDELLARLKRITQSNAGPVIR
jgi:hypothetical protein